MAATLFISESYIKKFTPIGKLIEWSSLMPEVSLQQDKYIQDMLGSNFYVYLQGVYASQSLNANETILVSKIKLALAFRSAEKALVHLSYSIKNKGVMSQSGDFSSSTGLDIVRYVRSDIRDDASFYEERLIKYLCENSALFPQYTTDNSDDMHPNSKSPYIPPITFL